MTGGSCGAVLLRMNPTGGGGPMEPGGPGGPGDPGGSVPVEGRTA